MIILVYIHLFFWAIFFILSFLDFKKEEKNFYNFSKIYIITFFWEFLLILHLLEQKKWK